MTLTSFSYFVFLLVVVLLYYIAKPLQKYILLLASIWFYLKVSSVSAIKLGILMIYVWAVTYFCAIIIDSMSERLRGICLACGIILLIAPLIILKYAYNISGVFSSIFSFDNNYLKLKFVAIIGISYYVLSAIGYLTDVCWQNYRSSKNPVDIALFIFYFPQLISGPFTRFYNMKEQFDRKKVLDYNNITYGMRRMALGYFKKLVISERFGVIVANVYGNYNDYSMIGIVGATLCYAVQLYTDFSGCMDIIIGSSMLFGIELPENFKAPFFSETIQEFWQRWHITLGEWFKDYVMYPVQKSKLVQYIGNLVKRKFGKKWGKKVSFYSAMFLLWILIGIWHGGTGYYFIASAGIPCFLLVISDNCQSVLKKLVYIFKINTERASWHIFRRIRTLFLICICWLFVCSGGTRAAVEVIKHMIMNPVKFTPFISVMESFGLNALDVLIMVVGILIIYTAQKLEYFGTNIFKKMDEQNLYFRVAMIYVEIIMIFAYGMVGSSAFIYFQF